MNITSVLNVGVIAVALCFAASCKSGDTSSKEVEEPKKEATNEEAKSTSETKTAAKPAEEKQVKEVSAIAPASELTYDALLKDAANLEGKEVTLKAISWGTSSLADGKQRLSLGQQKLEGKQEAQLVADFEKDDTKLDAIKKDAEVKLKCTVGKEADGARQLENCQIL